MATPECANWQALLQAAQSTYDDANKQLQKMQTANKALASLIKFYQETNAFGTNDAKIKAAQADYDKAHNITIPAQQTTVNNYKANVAVVKTQEPASCKSLPPPPPSNVPGNLVPSCSGYLAALGSNYTALVSDLCDAVKAYQQSPTSNNKMAITGAQLMVANYISQYNADPNNPPYNCAAPALPCTLPAPPSNTSELVLVVGASLGAYLLVSGLFK